MRVDLAVQLQWRPLVGYDSSFNNYAIYRSTVPFTDVAGMTPIAMVAGVGTTQYD